jgi:signal transduction histidine kinase
MIEPLSNQNVEQSQGKGGRDRNGFSDAEEHQKRQSAKFLRSTKANKITEQKTTLQDGEEVLIPLADADQVLGAKPKELDDRQQQEIFRTVLDNLEAERKRIAESIHNSLGQILYAAKLSLEAVDKSGLTENDKESMKNANRFLSDAIAESRRLSHELMPAILEDFGLKIAVEDICRKLNGRIQLKCRFKGSIKRLDKFIEIAIYRLVQELVMNVVKHADASDSLVAVEVYHSHVLVLVQDNGKGFNIIKEKGDGIGLKTIRNNVNLLNGSINITSKRGQGTTINIDIPLKTADYFL